MYGSPTETKEHFDKRSLWPSILNHFIEGGNANDITYESLLISQATIKKNKASRSFFTQQIPTTGWVVKKVNVTGNIYLPSNYHLFDANKDYWSLNTNKYILRISYSEPLILSDLAPYKVNVAVLFYCYNNNVLIYRALMDLYQELSKVQLIQLRDMWLPYDISVDNDDLKWYAFKINMNDIWDRISYQCLNDQNMGCVSSLDHTKFGTDETATRYDLTDMNAKLCNELCQHYSFYAVSGSRCYCDNGETWNVNPDHLIPNSFCRNCPDFDAADFCGDGLRDYWSIYKVNKLIQQFPPRFNMTEISHNDDKGHLYKEPLGYKWKSRQSVNAADTKCWQFEWGKYIAFTLHYKPLGLSDTKIGERMAIYHKPTGVLLKVIPLSTKNDEQIERITKSATTLNIVYTNTTTNKPFQFAEVFLIPSAYTDSIS